MRASVIVPTHRGAHRLPPLLAQLARQEGVADWEIVVVVDGLLDETPALLEDWRHRLPLTVVVNGDALGVAAALTRGFDTARGEYLIRCDDDLDIAPGFVAGHLTAQDGRRDRVVLSLTRDVFPDSPYAIAYGRPANERALASYYQQRPEYRWIHVAACFSLHRDAWAASGGFDPRFAYGEDSELGYRLMQQGCEILIDPTLEVGHRGPATTASIRVPRAFVSGASRRLFATVHPEASRPVSRPTGWKARAWDEAVTLLAATVRSRDGYARLGKAADRALALISPAAGGRLTALLVEAAGRAGLRHGTTDLHSFRGQKDAELGQELRAR